MLRDFLDTDPHHYHYGGKPSLPITFLGQALMVVGLIGAIIFGLIFWMENDSKSWQTTPGIVRVSQGSGSDKSTLRFSYNYAAKGKRHTGSAVVYSHRLLNGDWAPWEPGPREVTRKYPVGTEVTVYYDAFTPSDAILEPGLTWFGIGGLVLSIALLLWGAWVYLNRPFREIDKEEAFEHHAKPFG